MTRNSWHADGLRWIASLLESAATRLERPPVELVNLGKP